MNVVSYASIAFLIFNILACSFVRYRGRTSSRKTGDALPILSIIILLDVIASVVIAFVQLGAHSDPLLFALVIYLAVINFCISYVFVFEPMLPEPPATPKYLVKRISGSGRGSVVVSEQDCQDACNFSKKNANAVLVVTDARGNRIATISPGVSVQMHNKPLFAF